ncbi:putative DNA primase/helicase [Izhakiella capsodis]|uniref:Putative DNA primase/helicase n=1 Tax=Izhakiella capsodis TaxID=1367852 RepID=A0A1I4UBK6_9GAMM|nr:putative DNA primase/helicase [Izhakiella capsodis]
MIPTVNNNPMRFTVRSGGVSRRRMITHFPEQIAPEERDSQLKNKIARELAVIARQLMQTFRDPMTARTLFQSQQNSNEVLSIKRKADPTFDFCGYLKSLSEPDGMHIGHAHIIRVNRACICIMPIWLTWKPTVTGIPLADHVQQGAVSDAERV